jgi:four helix bundle protein
MTIKLEELDIYKISMEIGDIIYELVSNWDSFDKDSLGKQLVRAADSIALNISEGYGRFFYKEDRNFCYFSTGSAKETFSAVEKAYKRKLINPEQYHILNDKLALYFRLSFYYIKSIGTKETNEQTG